MKDENDLTKLSHTLLEAKIDFIEWIEFPENTITAIALKPNMKKIVYEFLKEFSLYN